MEKEEPRAWEGWWNEKIVELIQLSMQQKDAVTILLTGRSEAGFAKLLTKMVKSKGLDFDLMVLKPAAGPNNQRFSSTMNFKQVFLETLIETYRGAEEIRVYEDRAKHTKAFREFFTEYNKRQNGVDGSTPTRGPIIAEVVQVADGATQLDPVQEAAEVQRLINDHNASIAPDSNRRRYVIKKTVYYTGYLIGKTDTQKLLTLAQFPSTMPDTEMKFLANNILITPRPCQPSILAKAGGMGSKMMWEVTGTAVFESKIWAASVRPVPANSPYYTENPVPMVVLALRKGARPIDAGKIQNWQPVPPEKQYMFETTVGEKVLLRIEEEDQKETEYESLFPSKNNKRKHGPEDDAGMRDGGPPGRSAPGGSRGNHQQESFRGGRGGRGNHRGQRGTRGSGGGRGNGGRGRGRGGGGGYKNYQSLDDVGNNTPAYNAAVSYEEFPPLQKQYQTPQQLVQQQFQQYQQYQQQMQGKNSSGAGGNKSSGGNGELQYF